MTDDGRVAAAKSAEYIVRASARTHVHAYARFSGRMLAADGRTKLRQKKKRSRTGRKASDGEAERSRPGEKAETTAGRRETKMHYRADQEKERERETVRARERKSAAEKG